MQRPRKSRVFWASSFKVGTSNRSDQDNYKPLNTRDKKMKTEWDRWNGENIERMDSQTPVRTNGRVHTRPFNKYRYFDSHDFRVELEGEIKAKVLEEELERLIVSHREDVQRYEAELLSGRQLVDTLHCELQGSRKEVQKKDDLVTYSRNLVETLELRQHVLECELQEEREKNKALQEELEAVKVCEDNEDRLQYETQLTNAKQLVDSLQESMKEIQEDNLVTNSKDLRKSLKPSEHYLKCDLQAERVKNMDLQEELEGRTVYSSEASLKYKTELINPKQLIDVVQRELQQEKHQKEVIQEELEELQSTSAIEALKEAEESEEMPCMKQETICDAAALEVQEEALSETTPKKPSFWKRTRHFLGLRKPWRKKLLTGCFLLLWT